MAFPASLSTLNDALRTAMRTAASLKTYSISARDQMAAVNVSGNLITDNLLQNFKAAIEQWESAAALPGIGQFAKDQFDDPALDIGAEFTAMVNAAKAVRDWVVANFPKDAGGKMSYRTLNLDGSISVDAFTPGQTTGLRTQLDAFIATVG